MQCLVQSAKSAPVKHCLKADPHGIKSNESCFPFAERAENEKLKQCCWRWLSHLSSSNPSELQKFISKCIPDDGVTKVNPRYHSGTAAISMSHCPQCPQMTLSSPNPSCSAEKANWLHPKSCLEVTPCKDNPQVLEIRLWNYSNGLETWDFQHIMCRCKRFTSNTSSQQWAPHQGGYSGWSSCCLVHFQVFWF